MVRNSCVNRGSAAAADMCGHVGRPDGAVSPVRVDRILFGLEWLVRATEKNQPRGQTVLRTVLFVVGGAAAGFLYSHFVGCRSGYCPLTSNQYVATVYGAVLGLLLGQS